MTFAGAVVGALAILGGSAQAATTYDADLAAPGVYFGDGNPNGHFTIETGDGIELGLRARPNPLLPIAPTSTNVYDVALGSVISFDWSFNPGMADLSGFSSLLTITNLGTGGTASYDPGLVPDNDTDPGAPGGYQNSWQLGFSFLNGVDIVPGLIPALGDIDYDANVDSTYEISWTVSGDNFAALTNTIVVNQGAGAAVPEPATWALMIGGFGLAGASLRARRRIRTA